MSDARSPSTPFDVLVIEEEEVVVSLMAQLLSRIAHCRYASSVSAAQNALQERAPDLVMLSASLPDGDGFALCARIRQSSTVPILMMSKAWTDKDELRGLQLGADGFVHQPYNSQLMVANAIAQLRRAYRYDHQPAPSHNAASPATGVPAGWAVCDACGYMGPQTKFERPTPLGKIRRVCPHCGEEATATYSLG